MALGGLAALFVASRLQRGASPGGTTDPVPVSTSDLGERCLDCHGELVESWRRTGMARALGPILPGELSGLAGVLEEPTGLGYRFGQDGGRAVLVETLGPDHVEATPLAFAIGAGDVDRSFVAVRGAAMWFAPLEVVSAHGGVPRRAALAPGHAIAPGTRYSLPITPECLGCHTDAPPPPAFPRNLLPEPDAWEPRGIACRTCHGPTEAHAAWQEADLTGEEPQGRDPILSPAELGRIERLSICAACHLQGDARVLLEPGAVGPPAPGGDLLLDRAVFVAAEPTDEIGFVSQVERLVLSRCFLGSETMVCGTCHDPHRSIRDERERARVRAACTGCHPATGSAGDGTAPPCSLRDPARKRGRDCARCHMRETPVFDVDGVRIHDHLIRVAPGPPSPRGPLRVPEAPGGDWRRFAWPGREPVEHVDDPGIWMMALDHGGHFERAAELVDRPPGPRVAALPMAHHVRASLLERLGRDDDAARAYGRALELDPGLAESRCNLGLLLARLGRPAEGLALLDELVAEHPRAPQALRNRALVRQALGHAAGLVADLEAAQRILPSPEVAAALAEVHRSLDNAEAARRWAAEARRLDPLGRD